MLAGPAAELAPVESGLVAAGREPAQAAAREQFALVARAAPPRLQRIDDCTKRGNADGGQHDGVPVPLHRRWWLLPLTTGG